jgi:hypothetical protein
MHWLSLAVRVQGHDSNDKWLLEGSWLSTERTHEAGPSILRVPFQSWVSENLSLGPILKLCARRSGFGMERRMFLTKW